MIKKPLNANVVSSMSKNLAFFYQGFDATKTFGNVCFSFSFVNIIETTKAENSFCIDSSELKNIQNLKFLNFISNQKAFLTFK